MTAGKFEWRGAEILPGESNYFLGKDPAKWRTHVPHFARAAAASVLPGVDVTVYGNEEGLEYDLRLAPGADARNLRLEVSGADGLRLDAHGDLMIRAGEREIRMRKPAMYEERAGAAASEGGLPGRRPVDGGYELEADGTVGFRVAQPEELAGNAAPESGATLVIDPSLSVAYSSFLGGAGEDTAAGIALDGDGNVYISGTTTSATTFSETPKKTLGPGGGASDYFIAMIDPTVSGSHSLKYLTFIGGSGAEAGGFLAVYADGHAAIAGTTTSTDFPVTDGSVRTTGANATNDATVTEIDPSGASLVYSTLFGGNGAEATQGPGGIAMDASGNIFVAMDTSSTNLLTTPGAFQPVYGGGISDGFLAKFNPSTSPHLMYCTYLGLDAQASVAGVAVDSLGNAYLAGFTTNPGSSLNTTNGFQTAYGGDPSDGFVMKILPGTSGAAALSYATFLGGGNLDKALAIAVGPVGTGTPQTPPTVYVTGTTQSSDFPTNGTVAAFQTTMKGTANAFLAVIAQSATTGMTSLAYSTYLGGSETDSGQSVWFAAGNEVYVAGSTTSWNFPHQFNFEPYNGDMDAFVAELDPTSAGAASLLYSTPLGGTAPAGVTAESQGNSIALDASGNVYLAGASTANDFPLALAGSPGTGFQPICASCLESPPASDAFVVEITPSTTPMPSVWFNVPSPNFGGQPVGSQNVPPASVEILNSGDALLNIQSISITGPNSGDFSIVEPGACFPLPATVSPGASCSFGVQFSPSIVGIEGAFVSFTDNAPGNPQVLAVQGTGTGPLASLSPSNVSFGTYPIGTTASQTVTLTNIGIGEVTLQITQYGITGAGDAQFQPGSDDTCVEGPLGGLAAGSSCNFQVLFEPQTSGTFQAQFQVIDNSGGVSGSAQVVTLSGTGVPAAPLANVSPSAVTFGTQAVGTTSGNQTVTVQNQGSAPLNLSGIAIVGGGAANFGIVAAGSTPCPTGGGSVAAGASCTVAVYFAPASSGAQSANLSISDNASGSPQMVTLSGTGASPGIALSPASLNFGAQSVGTTSAAQSITLSNTGSGTLGVSGITLTGANSGDFAQTNNCPASLGAAASCMVSVKFAPTAAGSRAAAISVADNAPASPQAAALTGSGTVADVSLSASSINFGTQVAGATVAPVSLTVTNTGAGALVVSGASLSDTTDFTLANKCTGSVITNATCTIQVTFNPPAAASGAACGSTAGAKIGTLTLTDNASNNPQTVTLSGTSTDFCPDPPSPGGTTATVTPGQTANYKLNITSENGFADTVALACVASIPNGACTTSAPNLTVAANGEAAFQVNVTTAAAGTVLGGPQRDLPLTGGRRPLVPLAGLLGLFLLLALRAVHTAASSSFGGCGGRLGPPGRRTKVAALARLAQAYAIFVLLALGMAACGGGSSAPTGTPANTYALTLTATAATSGVKRTIGLTLIVQ
jgi:hypothetical protein